MFSRSRRTFRILSLAALLAVIYSWFCEEDLLPRFYSEPESAPLVEAPALSNRTHEQDASNFLRELKYRRDGLVEVDEDGPHPIHDLISRAERSWQRKLNRASKTLEDAVKEYERRYSRAPPLGFDQWWNYAQQHNVQLPDEYDTIFQDLEPFWGIEPTDLLAIRDELESKQDSYTIGQTNEGLIDVVNYTFAPGTYSQLIQSSVDIIDLLREVEEMLPPFRAVFSPHDGPNRLSDYGVRFAAFEAAAIQTYISRSGFPQTERLGWASACAPSSPARAHPINLDSPPPVSSKKTFIHDHVAAMNPCLHPQLFHQHGFFLAHNLGPHPPRTLVPEFAFCTTALHHNVRIPNPYGWVEDLHRADDPEWAHRIDERVLWRGSNTGIFHAPHTRWRNAHRSAVVRFANVLEGTARVLLPTRTCAERVGPPKEIRNAMLNPAAMDITFAGRPILCEPKTCEELERTLRWAEKQTFGEAGNYKYILDVSLELVARSVLSLMFEFSTAKIDGNGWSSRFKRLMTSNALVFKATIYPEWYMDRIAPWVHYVPVQVDMSDLHDALFFFRGDGNGDGAHEDLGRKIAVAGRQWSKSFWRREDMIAYFFRLMLEYARLMNLDRDAMSFKLPNIEEPIETT
ncbi:hypothetical protein H0H81_004133 [Sphagnurus paluster]|uniref:Glycosyl transferase CAP10 domain-containing protein n=1 Tax=Sphagnurus paluster TaxID=117069 RepID=A0A9P7K470_9AGAR|nr:hypothetical protein H0H81_004133 [Sphagnurus paluster]